MMKVFYQDYYSDEGIEADDARQADLAFVLNMESIAKHVEIIKLLIPHPAHKKVIMEQMKFIAENQDSYLANSDRMLDRSDDYLWLAMVDLLIDSGYAFEIDWKESYSGVRDYLVRLFEQNRVLITLEESDDFDWEADAEEFFPVLNKLLEEQGVYRLYNIDIDSDSYVSVLGLLDKQELLQRCDHRIKLY